MKFLFRAALLAAALVLALASATRAETPDDIVRVAEFITTTAHALHELQPAPPQIATLSVGACLVTPEGEWDDWYALADAALYRAKRLGGNRVEWQDAALAPA